MTDIREAISRIQHAITYLSTFQKEWGNTSYHNYEENPFVQYLRVPISELLAKQETHLKHMCDVLDKIYLDTSAIRKDVKEMREISAETRDAVEELLYIFSIKDELEKKSKLMKFLYALRNNVALLADALTIAYTSIALIAR